MADKKNDEMAVEKILEMAQALSLTQRTELLRRLTNLPSENAKNSMLNKDEVIEKILTKALELTEANEIRWEERIIEGSSFSTILYSAKIDGVDVGIFHAWLNTPPCVVKIRTADGPVERMYGGGILPLGTGTRIVKLVKAIKKAHRKNYPGENKRLGEVLKRQKKEAKDAEERVWSNLQNAGASTPSSLSSNQ